MSGLTQKGPATLKNLIYVICLIPLRALCFGGQVCGPVFAASSAAQEWPAFRGPDGQGHSTESNPPIEWSESRNVACAPLTPSPIVVGDELYVVTDGGIATCLDARTGATIWQQRLGGTYSASPVFAGGSIYFPAEQGVTTVIAPGTDFAGGPPIVSMAGCWRRWPSRAARCS